MKKYSHGFAPILIILLIAATGIIGYLGYKNMSKNPTPISNQSPQISQNSTDDPTANWKTYTNTKYNFSFKYPLKWKIVNIGTTYKDTLLLVDIQKTDPKFENCTSQGPCENSAHIQLNVGFISGVIDDFDYDFWGSSYPIAKTTKTQINNIEVVHGFNADNSPYPMGTLYKIKPGIQLYATSEFFNFNDNNNETEYSKQTIEEINQALSTVKLLDSAVNQNASNLKTFTTNDQKLSFKYPATWQITDQETSSEGWGKVVTMATFKKGESDMGVGVANSFMNECMDEVSKNIIEISGTKFYKRMFKGHYSGGGEACSNAGLIDNREIWLQPTSVDSEPYNYVYGLTLNYLAKDSLAIESDFEGLIKTLVYKP